MTAFETTDELQEKLAIAEFEYDAAADNHNYHLKEAYLAQGGVVKWGREIDRLRNALIAAGGEPS